MFGNSNNKSLTTPGFGNKTQQTSSFSSSLSTTPQVENIATLTSDPLFNRVWNLRCAYSPDSPAYHFCYVFYNKKIDSNFPTCPSNISESDWIKLCTEVPDPDHLVPCPVYGFEALKERAESQRKVGTQLQERIDMYKLKLREMSSFYATELQGSFEKIKQNSYTINQLMMKYVEIEDVKNQWSQLSKQELELESALKRLSLEEHNQRNLIAELQEKAQKKNQNRNSVQMAMDKNSLVPVASALKIHQDAIMALEMNIKKLQKDISIIESNVSNKII